MGGKIYFTTLQTSDDNSFNRSLFCFAERNVTNKYITPRHVCECVMHTSTEHGRRLFLASHDEAWVGASVPPLPLNCALPGVPTYIPTYLSGLVVGELFILRPLQTYDAICCFIFYLESQSSGLFLVQVGVHRQWEGKQVPRAATWYLK